MTSRFLRWVCALSIALGAFVVATRAEAQAVVSITQTNPDRTSPNNDLVVRDQARNPTGINFDDCVKDAVLTFPIIIQPFPTDGPQLQVWEGNADCTDRAQRTSPSGLCNPVSARISLTQTLSVAVRGQDIAAHIGDQTASGDYTPAGPSACTKQTAPAGTQLNLYFILLTSANDTEGTAATYPIFVDTVGPPAPTRGDPIGLGDTLLVVKWTPATDTDTAGFRVFCDPKPGNEGRIPPDADVPGIPDTGIIDTGAPLPVCPDASVEDGGDAGVDLDACAPFTPDSSVIDSSAGTSDGGLPTPTCSSTVLEDGKNGSSVSADFQCGDLADKGASELQVDGLINGDNYTFAVAATDISNNAGPMTVIGCESPQSIDDFWKKYRQAGGEAGGGFCTLEAVGMPAGTSVFLLGMIGVAVAAIRRRRRS